MQAANLKRRPYFRHLRAFLLGSVALWRGKKRPLGLEFQGPQANVEGPVSRTMCVAVQGHLIERFGRVECIRKNPLIDALHMLETRATCVKALLFLRIRSVLLVVF